MVYVVVPRHEAPFPRATTEIPDPSPALLAPPRGAPPARPMHRGTGWYMASQGEIRPAVNVVGMGGPLKRGARSGRVRLSTKIAFLPLRAFLAVGELLARLPESWLDRLIDLLPTKSSTSSSGATTPPPAP